MFQLGNQIAFEEMCQGDVINQGCSNWKGSGTTRNGHCVLCWKWWWFSTEHVSKNILRLLRDFVIKSNLNKIIALLLINWFYRYILIVLQEMQNAREILVEWKRTSVNWHLKEKWKNELFISVLRQMEFRVNSVFGCIFREGNHVFCYLQLHLFIACHVNAFEQVYLNPHK